ncbi:MAG: 16S rRNA (uracil(1498)-N(3))-methyltransferase [Pedobacter sp.]
MHRFFVAAEALQADNIDLPEEILRHIAVLRLARGEEILLLDGHGNLCHCRIDQLDRKRGAVVVLSRHSECEKVFPIELMQALPKADKMDLVLQKGTELGINRFTPLQTSRSVPRLANQREEQRRQRWLRIIREAARQCRRPLLPELGEICTLDEALANCHSELRLMLWEEGSQPLETTLPEKAPSGATVLIGPEGGFSEQEAEIARRHGFIPVLFGPRILRSETAGFAAATILQYRYGDLGACRS